MADPGQGEEKGENNCSATKLGLQTEEPSVSTFIRSSGPQSVPVLGSLAPGWH